MTRFGGRSMRIAVDIDGVLGDHVNHTLNEFNKKYGYKYSKNEIIKWNSPIGKSSIDIEIEEDLLDPNYVLTMPLIERSPDAIYELHKNFTIIIATARPIETQTETLNWLSNNFIFDEFLSTRGKGKAFIEADILIDDNLSNIHDFASIAGIGILFDQPWNKENSELNQLISSKKVYCCRNWIEILRIIKDIPISK